MLKTIENIKKLPEKNFRRFFYFEKKLLFKQFSEFIHRYRLLL